MKMTSVSHEKIDGNVLAPLRKPIVAGLSTSVRGGGVLNFKGKMSIKSPRSRRVSCLDLGSGEHEGWLYTRKPKKKKWEKCTKWCVLKEGDLFIYSSKMDTQASSRISLPNFTISDASKETKEKKYADKTFKIYNSGTVFYFRCLCKDDRNQWLNVLGLASISYKPTSGVINSYSTESSGPSSGPSSGYDSRDYSDSESEDTVTDDAPVRQRKSARRSDVRQSKVQSHIDTNDELRKVVSSIREADLDLGGVNIVTRRQSQLRKSLAPFASHKPSNSQKLFAISAKERQLQKLEDELQDIECVLSNVCSETLHIFLQRYPRYDTKPCLAGNTSLQSFSSLSIDSSSSENLNNNCSACQSDRATLVPTGEDDCVSDSELLTTRRSNRRTVVIDNDFLLSAHEQESRSSSASSRGSTSSQVFQGGKHRQIITHI